MNFNVINHSRFAEAIVNVMDYVPIVSSGKSIVKLAQRALSSDSLSEVENVAKTVPHSYCLVREEKNAWRDIVGLVPIIGNIALGIFDVVTLVVNFQHSLANMYIPFDKKIMDDNYEKYVLQGAKFGNTEAMTNLARICFHKNTLQDDKMAIAWLYKAIDFGDMTALVELGCLYLKGRNSIKPDPQKAVQFFLKAAEMGSRCSIIYLGYCYKEGIGVDKNPKEAVKWFEEGVKKKLNIAEALLAMCYYEGEGVPEDKEQAKKLCYRSLVNNTSFFVPIDDDKLNCNLVQCYEEFFPNAMERINQLCNCIARRENKYSNYALALRYEKQLLIPHKVGAVPNLMKKIHTCLKEASSQGHKEAAEKLNVLFPFGPLEHWEQYEKGPYIS